MIVFCMHSYYFTDVRENFLSVMLLIDDSFIKSERRVAFSSVCFSYNFNTQYYKIFRVNCGFNYILISVLRGL